VCPLSKSSLQRSAAPSRSRIKRFARAEARAGIKPALDGLQPSSSSGHRATSVAGRKFSARFQHQRLLLCIAKATVRAEGVEPSLSVWKTAVLSVEHHARMTGAMSAPGLI
jgi:hypothetical protein